jgi:hypothetical protein
MASNLLQRVIEYYLKSRDFNGLYIDAEGQDDIEDAKRLVTAGLVQVVAEVDWMNPHIRPWPSKRSIEQQLESLSDLSEGHYGLCLYPTPEALRKVRVPRRFTGQPYRQAMAKGRGTLELAYFRFDVLESYRNDPRFHFNFNDYGARASISDDVYLDENEQEADKITIDHIGFAYDLSAYERDDPQSLVIRRVCAFYSDLADLSPLHQQRWKTYEVDGSKLEPHPVWWGQQMGHWPNRLGPFERLFFELRTLNEFHERAFDLPLLGLTDRPSSFGWILRPSQDEFERFVHDMDKILSENLRHEAFDFHGVPRKDDRGQNIGPLNRLDRYLLQHRIPEDIRKELLAPLKDIRRARQRPAHVFSQNINDQSFVHRQANFLERVTNSIEELRRFFQTHPANETWEEPDYASKPGYRL